MEETKQQQTLTMVESPKGITTTQYPQILQIQNKVKEFQNGFQSWVSKQPLQIEAAIVTATGAIQGGFIGGIMGTLTKDQNLLMPTPPPGVDPSTLPSLQTAQALSGGPLIQARNFAVMTGVNAGISAVLRRVKGKEDVQSSMIAAFGSGAAFTLVSGMGGPNLIQNAVTSGIFFSLAQGAFFKLGEKFSAPKEDDPFYLRTRGMLLNLGLEKYERNFKRGLLNDQTLPLLTDSALRDVKIPPGPRLLILNHLERDPELTERRRK